MKVDMEINMGDPLFRFETARHRCMWCFLAYVLALSLSKAFSCVAYTFTHDYERSKESSSEQSSKSFTDKRTCWMDCEL